MSKKNSKTANRVHWNLSHKERFEDLFRVGFQSDFTLLLGSAKEEVKVHKIFLQSGSRILFSMIEKVEGKGQLELRDVDPHFFKLLIQYLYTGIFTGVSMADAFPLLKLATDFEVPELRKDCTELLSKGELTDENALQIFQLAMEYAHKELITYSLEYTGVYLQPYKSFSNGTTILDRDEFSLLRLESCVEIISQDKLCVKDEIQVFDAVYRWGIAECKRHKLDDSDSTTLQKVLAKPLKHDRFPLMDKEKFALHVATKNVLSMEESMALLMCFLVSDGNRSALPGGRFLSTPRLSSPLNSKILPTVTFSRSVSKTTAPLVTQLQTQGRAMEKLSFQVTNQKRPVMLTAIAFYKESFGRLAYVASCGYSHTRDPTNLIIKTTLSNNIDPSTCNEGIILQPCNLNGRDGYCCTLLNKNVMRTNVMYELTFEVTGGTICSRYSNSFSCNQSQPQFVQVSCINNFERHDFIKDASEAECDYFNIQFHRQPLPSRFIAQLRFDSAP